MSGESPVQLSSVLDATAVRAANQDYSFQDQSGGPTGACMHAQALNAQAAGAKALLVYDDQINDYFVPASNGSIQNLAIVSGSIPRRTGQLLVSAALVSETFFQCSYTRLMLDMV